MRRHPRHARAARPPSWIAPGTRNFRFEPAMSAEQCTRAIETGRTFATDAIARGSNALLLGEMGIGNTACAAMLLHRRTGWPLADASGAAPGLDDAALERKRQLLPNRLRAVRTSCRRSKRWWNSAASRSR